MDRDYRDGGPMAGLGFNENELGRYNWTDHELLQIHRDADVRTYIASMRDSLIRQKRKTESRTECG